MLSSGFFPPPNALFNFLDLADHLEQLAFNVDFLADRIGIAEKFLSGVSAEDDHRSTPLVVDFAEPSARSQIQIEDIFCRRGVAFENCLLGFAVAILDDVGPGAKLRFDIRTPAVTAFTCGRSFMASASSNVNSLRVRNSSVGRRT